MTHPAPPPRPARRILFGYEGQKIVPKAKGAAPIDGRTDQIDGSGVDEWLANLNDDEVQFSLLKMTMGDRESKRPKFVMVTWIGPSVGVMKKAKAGMHGGTVKEFVGQIHNEMQEDDKESLTFDIIRKKVKSAMGADYDMGSNSRKAGGAGEANSYQSQQSDIKAKAKAAYQQAEKETTIGAVVFDQGPLTKGITACDLGGRATTASNTEAKKNMSKVMVDATGEVGREEVGAGACPLSPPRRTARTQQAVRDGSRQHKPACQLGRPHTRRPIQSPSDAAPSRWDGQRSVTAARRDFGVPTDLCTCMRAASVPTPCCLFVKLWMVNRER